MNILGAGMNRHLSGYEGMARFKVALVLTHIGLAQDERRREPELESQQRQKLTRKNSKRFGMKVETEVRDFIRCFQGAFAHDKQSEEPCMGTSKTLMIYARHRSPYVPGISDQLH